MQQVYYLPVQYVNQTGEKKDYQIKCTNWPNYQRLATWFLARRSSPLKNWMKQGEIKMPCRSWATFEEIKHNYTKKIKGLEVIDRE